jgi:hypothetical protein
MGMELEVDVGEMEAQGVWFAPNVPRTWKTFLAHPMVLLGEFGQVEAHFGLFRDSVNLGAR